MEEEEDGDGGDFVSVGDGGEGRRGGLMAEVERWSSPVAMAGGARVRRLGASQMEKKKKKRKEKKRNRKKDGKKRKGKEKERMM